MPINDEKTLRLKLNQLNEIFLEVKAYKQAHPEARCGYYPHNPGSLLNAYREGDISFDECAGIFWLWRAAYDMQQAQGRVVALPPASAVTDERPLVEIPGTLRDE